MKHPSIRGMIRGMEQASIRTEGNAIMTLRETDGECSDVARGRGTMQGEKNF